MIIDDKIADSLGVPPINELVCTQELLPVPVHDNNQDFDLARGHIISVIEKGQSALDGILDIAERTQSARGYEVVATLIKTLSDSSKDLLELSKRKNELQINDGPTTVNNNLFVGSTSELLKMLKSANVNSEK